MSKSFDSLNQLMDSQGLTTSDLEYIVKYLINEGISPQLAMRRIKSFEKLKKKLEDNTDQEVITSLREELEIKDKSIQSKLEEKDELYKLQIQEKEEKLKEIIDEKSSLESEKQELENLSDLFESEREELKNQLKLIQEMDHGDPNSDPSTELTDLTDTLKIFTKDLTNIINSSLQFDSILSPIRSTIETAIKTPSNYSFNVDEWSNNVNQLFESTTSPVSVSDDSNVRGAFTKEVKRSDDVRKTEVKKESAKPSKIVKKEISTTQGASKEEINVLNLFLDFIKEADNDKDFRNRIDTICDMDEAYEHLGSIGLSQVYSFVTKDLAKKDELMKLLNSWKEEGIPR